mgnify:CR=1 FL=1
MSFTFHFVVYRHMLTLELGCCKILVPMWPTTQGSSMAVVCLVATVMSCMLKLTWMVSW